MDAVDRINLRLKKLIEYLRILRTFKGVSAVTLRRDIKTRGIVERYLQLACEVVLDIANLLNAEYRFRPATDSRESILILGEEGILNKKFAEEFSKMAGFRNILVHDYLKIDYDQVADKINHRLGDFEKFSQQVAKFLK